MKRLISTAKGAYSLSKGVLSVFGFVFLFAVALSAVSHATFSWVINGTIINWKSYTQGFAGYVYFAVLIIFVLGTLVTLAVKTVDLLLRNKHHEDTKSAKTATQKAE